MAVTALLRLAKLCDRRDFAAKAEQTLHGYKAMMEEHPSACGQMLIALDFFLGPVEEIAVVGQLAKDATGLLEAIRGGFRPNQIVAAHDVTLGPPPSDLIPLLRDRPMVDGSVTTYVCENSVCQAPLVGVTAAVEYFRNSAE